MPVGSVSARSGTYHTTFRAARHLASRGGVAKWSSALRGGGEVGDDPPSLCKLYVSQRDDETLAGVVPGGILPINDYTRHAGIRRIDQQILDLRKRPPVLAVELLGGDLGSPDQSALGPRVVGIGRNTFGRKR